MTGYLQKKPQAQGKKQDNERFDVQYISSKALNNL